MRKLTIILLFFYLFNFLPSQALLLKRDYKQQFIQDALKAEKRKNDKSAFHLYEKLLYYYPNDESALRHYAEFCTRRKYLDKAILLYDKLYLLTNKNTYLYEKYLTEIRNNRLEIPQLKLIPQDKRLSQAQQNNLKLELINSFTNKGSWGNAKLFCSQFKINSLKKNQLSSCIKAYENTQSNQNIIGYYLRYHQFDPKDVEIIKKILDIAQKTGKTKLEETFLIKFSAMYPDNTGIKDRLGAFYIRTGAYYKASKIYEAIMIAGDRSEHIKNSHAYALYLLNPKGKIKNPYEIKKEIKEQERIVSIPPDVKIEGVDSTVTTTIPPQTKTPTLTPKIYKKHIPTKEELMYKALSKKNFKTAQGLLDEILKRKPNDSKMIKLRADIALEQNDYKNAIIYLEKLNNKKSKKPLLSVKYKDILAYAYFKTSDYESALRVLDKLIIETNNNPEFINKALGYSMAQKDWDRAFIYVEKALEKDPNSEHLLKTRGDLLSIKKDFENAANTYKTLTQSYPKKDYLMTLANLYLASNNTGEAENILENLYNSPDKDTEITQLYLIVLLSNEKINEAYIIAKDNDLLKTKEGYIIQGDIAFKNKKYNKAVSYYKEALEFDSDNESLLLKLAESYRLSKDYFNAENLYDYILSKNPANTSAQMGLGYLALDKKELKKSRKIFKNILAQTPEHKDANMGVIYSYKANGDNIKVIEEIKKLPFSDEKTNLAKAESYYDLGMYSDAEKSIQNNNDNKSKELKYKIKKEEAVVFNPNYSLLIQKLDQLFKLDYNQAGIHLSKYIDKNINLNIDYNIFIYSSGRVYGFQYDNATNEVKVGAEGRPSEKIAFKANAGIKMFQDHGQMANTDSWIKYYFNDDFNLKLGFKRDNVIQSYLSAVGLYVDGKFTGQVPDNKIYLEYEARHPKQFYSFGRAGLGTMGGQNLPNNPYLEGMIGAGKILYNNNENRWIQKISADIVSYNAAYEHNLLKIYNSLGDLFGGYWSPGFFTADNLNLKFNGQTKNSRLVYELRGFAGGQAAFRPNQYNAIWGVAANGLYNINDHVGVKLEYQYYNYAAVQRHLFLFNLLIKRF